MLKCSNLFKDSNYLWCEIQIPLRQTSAFCASMDSFLLFFCTRTKICILQQNVNKTTQHKNKNCMLYIVLCTCLKCPPTLVCLPHPSRLISSITSSMRLPWENSILLYAPTCPQLLENTSIIARVTLKFNHLLHVCLFN